MNVTETKTVTGNARPMTEKQPDSNKSFVVRYELLTIIVMMVLQLCGAIWWASTIAADVKYMRADITRVTQILETNTAALSVKINDQDKTILGHENRITRLESKGV